MNPLDTQFDVEREFSEHPEAENGERLALDIPTNLSPAKANTVEPLPVIENLPKTETIPANFDERGDNGLETVVPTAKPPLTISELADLTPRELEERYFPEQKEF